MKIIKIAIILIFSVLTLSINAAITIPMGIWQYSVYSDGEKIGSAITSVKTIKNQYHSINEITVRSGSAAVNLKEVIIETSNLKPVKIISSKTIIKGEGIQRNEVTIQFSNSGQVTISDGNEKQEITINDEFYIGSNYLSHLLRKNGFIEPLDSSVKIYDYSKDKNSLITMTQKFIKKELVTVNGKEMYLYHIVQTYGGLNDIHTFVDKNGTVYKTSVKALNKNITLELQKFKPVK